MPRTLEEIENEVAQLPKKQLRKFRAWYEKFDSDAWDEQIESDAKSGKLDALANIALADHKAGKTNKI